MPPDPLDRYMTPLWAGQHLLDQYFGDLASRDLLAGPTCGTGAFLQAASERGIPALGVEIDPAVAAQATRNTTAPILVGDFRTIDLQGWHPTVLLGNPPLSHPLIDAILTRAAHLLPPQGRAGFILPCYCFHTERRVTRWNARWAIALDMIPRTLFHGLRYPLVFARFHKDARKYLVGLALYHESASLHDLPRAHQVLLQTGRPRKGVWRALVDDALTRLGGCGTLRDIYAFVAPNRLPSSRFYHKKIRQVLQQHSQHLDRGVWALPAAPAA